MAYQMNKYRLMDISFIYFLKSIFDPLNVEVLEGFLEVDITDNSPRVAVDTNNIVLDSIELGNRNKLIIRSYVISVIAATKKQRDDIVYTLFESSEQPVKVYNYNEGFPPDVSPSQIGCLIPRVVDFEGFTYQDKEDKDIYRYMGSIKIEYHFDSSCK